VSEPQVSQLRSADISTMSASVAPGVRESAENRRDNGGAKHVVQFYESDAFLVGEVGRFLGMALGGGDAAVIIATKAHREGVEEVLRLRGLDLAQASKQGRYISLDAGETLSKFMIGGVPDRELFNALIGDVISRAKKAAWGREGQVAAFGEMVALLSAEGNHDAAIGLEQLWNALVEVHSFALRCAYSLSGFAQHEASKPFLNICAEHSRVLPAESYALIAEDEKHRAIAHLQQKAQALDAEGACAGAKSDSACWSRECRIMRSILWTRRA
jgi:hypothetical protein